MNSDNESIIGYFSSAGENIQKNIPCVFQSVSRQTDAKLTLHADAGKKPAAFTGYITNNINGVVMPVPNVRVSIIKDYVVPNATNKQYTANKVVLDWDMTDQTGKYVLFVQPGTYTIRVDGGKYSKYYQNQVVEDGLVTEYYYTIEALIKSRLEDTISFYGTEKRLVYGVMIDEFNKPVADAEIVVTQDEEVIVYAKTNKDGKYFFGIENGTYDVRLRAKDQSVTINRGFVFDDSKGFFTPSPRTIQLL